MNIKSYLLDDFERCISLFIEVFNSEPWNDKWSREKAERYLNDYIHAPGFKGIVAEEEGTINGFIFGISKRWWSADEFFIHEMCVRSATQRTGIGTRMFNYLDQMLKEEAIENITLLTDRGVPAEAFYIKNGFKEIKRIVFLSKSIK
ncbi:GNAT family N-acetyltransferase [Paenibacillus sp. NPDC058071]|uniref:GNAT family N-acetyltransferase n=1 Tax=Paenibacillus sp. NPDC058071 TaxID=3346326 RepID=UPI0036DD9215